MNQGVTVAKYWWMLRLYWCLFPVLEDPGWWSMWHHVGLIHLEMKTFIQKSFTELNFYPSYWPVQLFAFILNLFSPVNNLCTKTPRARFRDVFKINHSDGPFSSHSSSYCFFLTLCRFKHRFTHYLSIDRLNPLFTTSYNKSMNVTQLLVQHTVIDYLL